MINDSNATNIIAKAIGAQLPYNAYRNKCITPTVALKSQQEALIK